MMMCLENFTMFIRIRVGRARTTLCSNTLVHHKNLVI
jgi:hypothetical protein